MKKTILGVVMASVVALGASGCVVASDGSLAYDSTAGNGETAEGDLGSASAQEPAPEPAGEDVGGSQESNAMMFDPITTLALVGAAATAAKDLSEAYRNFCSPTSSDFDDKLQEIDSKLATLLAMVDLVIRKIDESEWKLERSLGFDDHYAQLVGYQETLRGLMLESPAEWASQRADGLGAVSGLVSWYDLPYRCDAPDSSFSPPRGILTATSMVFGSGIYLGYYRIGASMNYTLLDDWATKIEWIADQLDAYIQSGARTTSSTVCDNTCRPKPCGLCETTFRSCVFSRCVVDTVTYRQGDMVAKQKGTDKAAASLQQLIGSVKTMTGTAQFRASAAGIRKGPALTWIYAPIRSYQVAP